ncbi:MAG: YhbY family RNA-binding protein [Candidatus Thorarchaeota archaeon]|nr:YhbY family RNA-binding protein [Candidatus Thorarchaeota archaeon]
MPKKPDPTRIGIVWQEPAMMQIGKGGISEGVIKEATRLLKKHRYIKIRLLRTGGGSTPSRQEIFEKISASLGARLAGVRGNTAVIYRLRG